MDCLIVEVNGMTLGTLVSVHYTLDVRVRQARFHCVTIMDTSCNSEFASTT